VEGSENLTYILMLGGRLRYLSLGGANNASDNYAPREQVPVPRLVEIPVQFFCGNHRVRYS